MEGAEDDKNSRQISIRFFKFRNSQNSRLRGKLIEQKIIDTNFDQLFDKDPF